MKDAGRKGKVKFKVGQVVRCYGIPEIGEGDTFLTYWRIDEIVPTPKEPDKFHYILNGQLIRESRLKMQTKSERGA